jgi:hypothetical protein
LTDGDACDGIDSAHSHIEGATPMDFPPVSEP